MAEPENPQPQNPKINNPPAKPSSVEEVYNSKTKGSETGQRIHYPNPPEKVNPDAATLKDQWRFAIRQYSRWYSHAWGTAILAGGAFFALGWIIKGGNPLPSKDKHQVSPETN